MTPAPKQPDPALLASISEDIEAGRTVEAESLIAQVQAEGYGGEALAGLQDRLARAQFANALAGQLRGLVETGLPQPEVRPNRAQRRAAARTRKRR